MTFHHVLSMHGGPLEAPWTGGECIYELKVNIVRRDKKKKSVQLA